MDNNTYSSESVNEENIDYGKKDSIYNSEMTENKEEIDYKVNYESSKPHRIIIKARLIND